MCLLHAFKSFCNTALFSTYRQSVPAHFAETKAWGVLHQGLRLSSLKILNTRLSESYQEGFRREAEIIAELRHPNIIRILDYGIDTSDNSPYLCMDYARQGTLRKRHPKGSTVPLETLLLYVKQMASALQYAHDRNLIHRDLKPENLLVGENDEIVVSDFGIATVVHATSTLETSAYSGTAAYSAPEQILGKPRVQSDQYALGVILYEWLTGDLPFHGSFPELCAQHLYAFPQPLHEKVRGIPREVEEVVMTALAKDPHQRFKRIQAFAKALEQAYALSSYPTLLAEKPVPSQPTPTEFRPIQKPEQVPVQGEIVSIPPQQSAVETPLRIHEKSSEKHQEPVSSQDTPNEGKPEQVAAQKEVVSESQQSMVEIAPPMHEEQALQAEEERHRLAEEAERTRKIEEERQQRIEEEQVRQAEIEQALQAEKERHRLAEEAAQPAKVEEHTPSAQPPQRQANAQPKTLLTLNEQPIPSNQLAPLYGRSLSSSVEISPPARKSNSSKETLVPVWIFLAVVIAMIIAGVAAAVVATNPYPSYLPGSGTLAFYDPLSQPDNHWNNNLNSSFGGAAQFTQGAYHISQSKPGVYEGPDYSDDFSNFAFEVQMTITKGDCGGILFRYDGTKGSDYYLQVCQDGSYGLYLRPDNSGNNAKTLSSGSPQAIYTGYNQSNVIAVVANGNSLDLYINNQKIDSASDATYSHGTIALCAGDKNNSTEVIYSNAKVWNL